MPLNFYDNTRIRDYRECPRRYYFRHIKGWRPIGTATPLAAGLGWHSGMDFIWKHIKEYDDETLTNAAIEMWLAEMMKEGIDPTTVDYTMNEPKRTMGVFKEMFKSYIEQRRSLLESIEVISIERPFAVPLGMNTNNYYIGRIDKEFFQKGRIYVVDHKTTSAYAKSGYFRSTFLSSFSPDSQIDGYSYAAFLEYGDKFKAVWIDAALVHKTVHEGFKFIPIERAFNNLDAWLWEANYWVTQIEADMYRLSQCSPDDPYLAAFPKKAPESCTPFARSCAYQDICRFHSNPLSLTTPPKGFELDFWNPFEVNKIAQLGFEQEKGD